MNEKLRLSILYVILPITIIICLVILYKGFTTSSSEIVDVEQEITPRTMMGTDTIRAGDSLYVINFYIKKVLPDTIDCEAQSKYDFPYSDDNEDYR